MITRFKLYENNNNKNEIIDRIRTLLFSINNETLMIFLKIPDYINKYFKVYRKKDFYIKEIFNFSRFDFSVFLRLGNSYSFVRNFEFSVLEENELLEIEKEIIDKIKNNEVEKATLASAISNSFEQVKFFLDRDADWFEKTKHGFSFAELFEGFLMDTQKDYIKEKYPEKYQEYLKWKKTNDFNL